MILQVPHPIYDYETVGYGSGMLSKRANEWKEHSGMGELFLEDFKFLTKTWKAI